MRRPADRHGRVNARLEQKKAFSRDILKKALEA